jgi:hypothetical protein
LSEVRDLPAFNNDVPTFPTSASTGHLRPLLIRTLEENSGEYWGYQQDNIIVTVGYLDKGDEAATDRVRAAVRKVAFAALRDNDLSSIDVLAATVLPQRIVVGPDPFALPGAETRPLIASTERDRLLKEQFQSMFLLDEAGLKESIARGMSEMKKPGFEAVCGFVEDARKQLYVPFCCCPCGNSKSQHLSPASLLTTASPPCFFAFS